MQKIKSHRDLLVWQKALDMAVQVYAICKLFPKEEIYRLVSQMTRAAASVAVNIAEGHARGSAREYTHFLSVAKGSLMETETFLDLALRLEYIKRQQAQPVQEKITEVSKMLTVLRNRLRENL
ncbi:MAG: four helix bundle protein [Deltaproteobacteria bacterium]|nr:four helix bundle protein [Deltaproteobacteria bacterium]MBW1961129.1 four helix bundle protein [Deltaproteobacteria bacterium]MBW1994110.1 four helix bundle protein [Deltaproteobacteria bacterium]MBW2152648.1 four helix bundle protein [Deltaproteobacteria bacterium]